MKATFCIWSGYFFEFSFENAIREFVKCGVNAVELSSEHGAELFARSDDVVATGKTIREFVTEMGVTMTQGHLPLRFGIVSQRDEIDTLLRYIDLYEALGVRNMVLHCDRMPKSPELTAKERFDENVKSLRIIAEHIKNKDIYICLENLRQPASCPTDEPLPLAFALDLLRLINAVGSERFAICLDTGHLNLVSGKQSDFIHTAGKHLRALHIANNENKNDADQHMMPFGGRGTVDFFDVVRALMEIDYEGMFNYEIPGESHIPLAIRREKIKFIRYCYDYMFANPNEQYKG